MNDHDLLLAIQELLSGMSWTPATLQEVALILGDNGYPIREIDETVPAKGHYGEWCHDPKLCAGKSYCPRDPTCAD